MVRKIFLSCGIVSSVLYVITDVLGTLRYPGYSYADQAFSELTAQGAPTRDFMVALNVVPYTLLVAAFAGGVWTSATPKCAGCIAGAMLLGYAATGMVTEPLSTADAHRCLTGAMRTSENPPSRHFGEYRQPSPKPCPEDMRRASQNGIMEVVKGKERKEHAHPT
jgi:hypothetical protein